MPADLVDIESYIRSLPGVLGCVILSDPNGDPTEIQAFTGAETDKHVVQQAIIEELGRRGLEDVRQVFVFELEAETPFGDRETLLRAAELAEQDARSRGTQPGDLPPVPSHLPRASEAPSAATAADLHHRPPLQRVVFSSTVWTSQAEVALGEEGNQVVGQASGEKTSHGLRLLAQATLDAVGQLVTAARFDLQGASLVQVLGRESVVVLVREEGGLELLGAALATKGPVTEAAVRATLDAVNRRMELLTGRRL